MEKANILREIRRTADANGGEPLGWRPTLEAALASKYEAMLTISRDIGKRGQDGVDFCWMVKHSTEGGRTPIDLEKLAALGELAWPGGGGKEIRRLVDEVKAGKIPSIPCKRTRRTKRR